LPDDFLPIARPDIDDADIAEVVDTLRSGWLTYGPKTQRFESEFKELAGAEHAIATNSCTAGLHLSLLAAGIGPGDEVITSPFSFVASANCFLFEGATPVFADVDPATLNLDPAAVEAAITERTKAVVAVDIFGYPCELAELAALCDRRGLVLIDDACEALGAEYKGRPLGAQGPSAVFAFYPNKQVATGEGGVVTTHSAEERRLLVSLRNQGRSYEGGAWFHHVRLGYNYRWTDVQAAIGIAQLEKLDRILELRRAAAERYDALLAGVDGVERPLADDADHVRSWFVYVVKLAPEIDRDRVMAELRGNGVATAEYVPCIHLQPYMRERYGFAEGMFPVAESTSARTLALPFFTGIEPEDQERVAETLRAALA
jgi:perosamine synthetase